jgi:hypothetical protein
VSRRSEGERLDRLEREIERLRADLEKAEDALATPESGPRGTPLQADAVSTLAEARIEVDRAEQEVPWRAGTAAEARSKLDEAERQLAEGRSGSAVLFASRATRIATALRAEARRVEGTPEVRFIQGRRVNLRSAPSSQAAVKTVLSGGLPVFPERAEKDWLRVRTVSGRVGWVHASLVRP